MATLNISRIKCAGLGFMMLLAFSYLSIKLLAFIQQNGGEAMLYMNTLATFLVGILLSLFVMFWGIEPLMPELKW
jgi:hypothetical protein